MSWFVQYAGGANLNDGDLVTARTYMRRLLHRSCPLADSKGNAACIPMLDAGRETLMGNVARFTRMGMAMAGQSMPGQGMPNQSMPAAGGPPPPPPPASWHLVENGQSVGPFAAAQLGATVTAGRLHPDTLVWTQGMAEWVRAGDVPALTSLFAAQPPPPPVTG